MRGGVAETPARHRDEAEGEPSGPLIRPDERILLGGLDDPRRGGLRLVQISELRECHRVEPHFPGVAADGPRLLGSFDRLAGERSGLRETARHISPPPSTRGWRA